MVRWSIPSTAGLLLSGAVIFESELIPLMAISLVAVRLLPFLLFRYIVVDSGMSLISASAEAQSMETAKATQNSLQMVFVICFLPICNLDSHPSKQLASTWSQTPLLQTMA